MKRKSIRYAPALSRRLAGGCLPLALLAMIWFLCAAPAWAGSPGQRHKLVNQDEGQQPQYSKVSITISKKSLKHIFAIGKTLAVNQETVILGPDGKEVSLKKMLVPCDAEVFYLIEKGVPTAKRIKIKSVAASASWQWESEHPQ